MANSDYSEIVKSFFPLAIPEFKLPFSGRRYRYDWRLTFTHPSVLLEINGGVFMRGRSGHSSGTGLQRDYEKSRIAYYWGYIHICCTPDDFDLRHTLAMVKFIEEQAEGGEPEKIMQYERRFFPTPNERKKMRSEWRRSRGKD